jgi:hypothetical protein
LVSAAHALEKAARLDPVYRAQGIVPVFPIWESGLLEVLRSHGTEIFSETIFQVILKLVLKHAGGKISEMPGARGIVPAVPLSDREVQTALEVARNAATNPDEPEPLSNVRAVPGQSDLTPDEEKRFEAELGQSGELQQAIDEVMLGLGETPQLGARAPTSPVQPKDSLLSQDIKDELRRDARPGARGFFSTATIIKHAIRVLARVIKRYVQGRDHGLYATSVEEIGRELYIDKIGGLIWSAMKDDTMGAFHANDSDESHGGTVLLEEIAQLLAQRRGQSIPKLSVVAHSAGSIWTCHFLQAIERLRVAGKLPLDFQLDRVIFLAPACTSKLFTETLKSHTAKTLFSDFRIFALSDQLESGYWEAPPLYPRSLLYMVSGMFEAEADMPILGMERFITKTAIYNTAESLASREFLTDPLTRAVWAIIAAADGLSCDSKKHGDFDETGDPQRTTINSVLYMLSH